MARARSGLATIAREPGRRQRDALLAIERVDRLDRAVTDDRRRSTDRDARARAAPCRARRRKARSSGRPPRCRATRRRIAAIQLALRPPAIDRQAEGRFGDEDMAAQRLEGGGDAVILELVVARSDPDLAALLDPDLRRAEHMAGGVKRHADAVATSASPHTRPSRSRRRRGACAGSARCRDGRHRDRSPGGRGRCARG